MKKSILIEGYTTDEILQMLEEEIDTLAFIGKPIIFKSGSAEILGKLHLEPDYLIFELAQINGKEEVVLPSLWTLIDRFARLHHLKRVDWIVHAIHCFNPNFKLCFLLEKKGFTVQTIPDFGEVYYYKHTIRS
ncbi:MAG: hypothetical protein V4714_20005 [Bacteroidota bacterium]